MKETNFPRRFLRLFLISLLFFVGLTPVSDAVDDTIIAVVNNHVITLKNLHDFLQIMQVQLAASGKSEDEIRKIMTDFESNGLNKLIEERLLVDEADKKGMVIRPQAIENQLNEIKKDYPNEQAFLDAVVTAGLTVTDIKKRITDDLKTKFLIETEVKSKIFVNPQEVTDYYQKNFNLFLRPE